jgi:ribonuclease HI/uncharacterized phage-like protein YoqJ
VATPTIAYTDGACLGNPGPGGWAWVIPDGAFAAGADPATTNQRMEITAALEAVRAIEGPLDVVSDSTYVVNCFRDRWWEGWLRRGWVNSQKKPVANRDLWEPLIELVNARGDVTFQWVKGHSGDQWNDVADLLATEAAATQEPRSGDRPPEVAPAAAAAASASTSATSATAASDRDRRLPARPLLAVFGHRPPQLGGYDDNPIARDVIRRLREVVAAKRGMQPDLAVVSGLQLGAETLGAEVALEEGVPLIGVVAFPGFDAKWPGTTRQRFDELCAAAEEVIILESKTPESTQKVSAAMRRRDAWLARNVDQSILVWDESDPTLGKLARTLEEQLDADVWFLAPGQP